MPKAIFIHGFIGSGKTTFSKKLEEETGAFRFTVDEWMEALYGNNPPAELFFDYEERIKTMILSLSERLLRRGQDVILDFGFWSRKARDDMHGWAQKIGAEPVLYEMQCDIDLMRERTRKRTGDAPAGALFIDDNAFDLLYARFEPLQPDEDRIAV